jgi:thymidylate kinase
MIDYIIIEGPDCSGKSTVVNRIKNALRWDSKSLHHQEGDQFSRYLQQYALGKNTVFDRSHISEIVYSKLWRGGNPLTTEEENILNNIIGQRALVIFTCPDEATIEERYKTRAYEQQIKLEELKQSRNLFCETLKSIPHIHYTASSYEELDNLVRRVKNEILCNSN